MYTHILLIILGFVLLIKGADILVDGASDIAKRFNIPEIIIGLTIVAIGTSMPELMVSMQSAIHGHSDLAIGNVVGSNISNLFLILGVCSVIKGLKFKKATKEFENPFTIFCTVLFFILGNNGNEKIITKKEGLILLTFVFLFIMYNIIMSKKGSKFRGEVVDLRINSIRNKNVVWAYISVILGILALKFGGDIVVENSCVIARMLGVSEKMISLTIVAFSTSLPELITSITATCKGDIDMAIGNILGSQIFNILLIIGISAVITPIMYSMEYNKDIMLLTAGTVMLALFPLVGKKNEMTRNNGIIFLIIYLVYISRIISKFQ